MIEFNDISLNTPYFTNTYYGVCLGLLRTSFCCLFIDLTMMIGPKIAPKTNPKIRD